MAYHNQYGGGGQGGYAPPASQPQYNSQYSNYAPPPSSNYPSYQNYSPPLQQNYPSYPPQQNMNQGGYPPQQGYGPPPTHSPYPPQQQYGHQAPYGGQPGFAPPQGPPPGQYGAPRQEGYPQGQYGGPPSGPPPGQYGAPQQQYGAPAQQGYGAPAGPPNPPSPGYIPGQVAPVDMSREADALRSAMKGFGTDEKAMISVLSRLDALQVAGVRQAFQARHRRDLLTDIDKETSSYFCEGLLAIARGPLEQDCVNLRNAIKGLGTKENVINDVLLSRSNADMNAIKAHYHHMYKHSLESDLHGDLSLKTERLFDMVLAARRNEDSAPVIPQQIDADVQEIYRATEGQKVGTDQVSVCSILSQRSDGQIRAISLGYQQKYHRALGTVIKGKFSGHMEDALIFMLEAAEDRAKHDAHQLEAAMKGMGTKDSLLVNRVVRIHWNRSRMGQCRAAYRHFFKKDLVERIKGETRGDYEKLMVACVESGA